MIDDGEMMLSWGPSDVKRRAFRAEMSVESEEVPGPHWTCWETSSADQFKLVIHCPSSCLITYDTPSVHVVHESRVRVRRSCRTEGHRDGSGGNDDMHWRNVRLTLFAEELCFKDSDTGLRQTDPQKDDFEAVHRIRQDQGREQGDVLMSVLCFLTQHQALQTVQRELREYERPLMYFDVVFIVTNHEITEACTELSRGSSKCTRASTSMWVKQRLASDQNQSFRMRCTNGKLQTSQRR